MKTARIDVLKSQGEGLKLGANVSIVLTGKIKGLDTYDMMEGPVMVGEKKGKKEPPKVTINLEIEKTEINESKAPKKTSREAFEDAFKKKESKEE